MINNNLQGHKLKHNFSDCLDETCMCGKISNLRTISSCNVPYFSKKSKSSWMKFVIDQNQNSLCYTRLFGKENMNDSENTHILNATIEYILWTESSNDPLFE